jgi:hypothetical protein
MLGASVHLDLDKLAGNLVALRDRADVNDQRLQLHERREYAGDDVRETDVLRRIKKPSLPDARVPTTAMPLPVWNVCTSDDALSQGALALHWC